jgi:hypothetical protein
MLGGTLALVAIGVATGPGERAVIPVDDLGSRSTRTVQKVTIVDNGRARNQHSRCFILFSPVRERTR